MTRPDLAAAHEQQWKATLRPQTGLRKRRLDQGLNLVIGGTFDLHKCHRYARDVQGCRLPRVVFCPRLAGVRPL
jgi:hypothetical protein